MRAVEISPVSFPTTTTPDNIIHQQRKTANTTPPQPTNRQNNPTPTQPDQQPNTTKTTTMKDPPSPPRTPTQDNRDQRRNQPHHQKHNNGAEGGIRTHEFLRNRYLNPTPLTWLGDLRQHHNPPTQIINLPMREGRRGESNPGQGIHSPVCYRYTTAATQTTSTKTQIKSLPRRMTPPTRLDRV